MLRLTTLVALFTLLAVGAILLGPAIADCASKPGTVSACLHEKLTARQLLPAAAPVPIDVAVDTPVVTVQSVEIMQVPASLAAAVAPSVSDPLIVAPLGGQGGKLAVTPAPSNGQNPPAIALTPGTGLIAAALLAPDEEALTTATLAPPLGSLQGRAEALAAEPPLLQPLTPPAGAIQGAPADMPAGPPVLATLTSAPPAALVVTVPGTSAPTSPAAALTPLLPTDPPPLPRPRDEPVPPEVDQPLPVPEPAPEPESPPPVVVQSPSIILLPPPATGENSSIITLMLGG
jgi:hypothetical protein